MLTINKPAQHGYRTVHDLPTPPSTSRPSPPLISQDFGLKALPAIARGSSPVNQPMSAPHRGLPLPAAMPPVQPSGLSSQQPPSVSAGHLGQAPPPPPPSQNQVSGQFPAAPSWSHVTEESMRAWLFAKAEEEKRRQEEEKTRQESYRLEQRRTEHDILRTSLQNGIPPAMVPVVFAGMGGGALPQAALEWAQHYIYSQSQQTQHPPALLPPGPISPEHQRRDSQPQAYTHYPPSGGVPSTPGSAQAPPSGYMSGYPGSPTRPRGQSVPGPLGGRPHGSVTGLPSLNTNVPGAPGGGPGTATHPAMAQAQQQQQDAQPSPSIYFHHWQPPTSQGGGRSSTDQPATPSVGESPRKRKATGPQPPAPPPSSSQRFRSPPFSHSSGLSNPPPGRRRGHSRQRSDLGGYRGTPGRGGRGGEGFGGSSRDMSPMHTPGTGAGLSREREEPPLSSSQHQQHHQQAQAHQQHQHQQQSLQHQHQQQQAPPARGGAHSVSSLLTSDNPQSPRGMQYTTSGTGVPHSHGGEGPGGGAGGGADRRPSPRSSEEKMRGGGAGGSATTREGDND